MLTRRNAVRFAGLSLGIVASRAWAAPSRFWEAKAPAEWTGEEIHRMLTDSPWATAAMIRDVGAVSFHPAAQWSGLPKKTKPWNVTVRWESSPPIQAAINSADDLTNEDLQRYYVISLLGDSRVTGLLADNRELGQKLVGIRSSTTLEPANAHALQAEKLEEVSHESRRALRFYFLRRPPIAADAVHLYFATTIGRYEVMAKFAVDDMMYSGKLAL